MPRATSMPVIGDKARYMQLIKGFTIVAAAVIVKSSSTLMALHGVAIAPTYHNPQ